MFVSPDTSLGALDKGSAATLIGASSDITLVLDADGTVRDIAVRSRELASELDDSPNWIGQKLTGLVALDSRPKVATLIREAVANSESRWRHLNHMTASGASVPILYCAVAIGEGGRLILFGRDMRPMSDLQQRLVNVQQSLERDYSRMREVEARYRLLFQVSAEAVLILDADRARVTEANPAAAELFGMTGEELVGKSLAVLLDGESLPVVQAYLAAIRAGRRQADLSADVSAAVQPKGRRARRETVSLHASLLRQTVATLFLLRLSPPGAAPEAALPEVPRRVLEAVERGPDGFVLTDSDNNVLTANTAFLEMAELPGLDAARGEPLDRWLGQTGLDLDVLVNNLRQRERVRFFATVVRSESGAAMEVEVSGVILRNGGSPCFGYALRNVGPRLQQPAARAASRLPRSVEQLTELIGRVALKDLVREATEVIERLSIEAALELTGDNRASAAEMLGVSRQSLYVKLRRYGLGDLNGAEGE